MKKLTFAILFFVAVAQMAAPDHLRRLAAIRRIRSAEGLADGKTARIPPAPSTCRELSERARSISCLPAAAHRGRSATGQAGRGAVVVPRWKTRAHTVSNREGGLSRFTSTTWHGGRRGKLTSLDGGALGGEVGPRQLRAVLVSDIYPDWGVDPTCIKQKRPTPRVPNRQTARWSTVAFRHWNAWQEPTRATSSITRSAAPPRDLTPGSFGSSAVLRRWRR